MWKKILLALGGLLTAFVLVVLVLASTQPDDFRVERTTTIAAPPEVVYGIVSDFRQGKDWSPWEKLDPNIKKTFSGPDTGVGATYAWEGNADVGKGRQTIVAADPHSRVATDLEFQEPFEAHNQAEFLLKPEGNGTRLTWAMYGPQNFGSKVMCVFMDMDAMIGKDFEEGLSNIKRLAESKKTAGR